jgi:holo-[acyl-carrier protein] synthase
VFVSGPSVSVGIDLVRVGDVRSSIERFGDRYVARLFTEDEIAYCRAAPELAAERFAARFAAKEAVIKALRVEERPDLRAIEVRRAPAGWCDVTLHGEAKELSEAAGIIAWSVSMSHHGEYATAVVVAERRS